MLPDLHSGLCKSDYTNTGMHSHALRPAANSMDWIELLAIYRPVVPCFAKDDACCV